MSFLPAVKLCDVDTGCGGGIAFSDDGTLFASVDHARQCVNIYGIDGSGALTVAPVVVFGTPRRFEAALNFHNPRGACFVKHTHNLLIADYGNDRIVEVCAATGDWVRCIAMEPGSRPIAVAYCGTRNAIAVSLSVKSKVLLLQYASGAVIVTIGSPGHGDGQMHLPWGITYTADGGHVLVADYLNDRVSKFDSVTGAFVAHVATKEANAITWPTDVIECEDGSIIVVVGKYHYCSVVHVGTGGEKTLQTFDFGGKTVSLIYCSHLQGVVVKNLSGKVFLFQDSWIRSSRCEWLSALCVT